MRAARDRRPSLVVMPRTTRRSKRPPEEYPSSLSVEFISVTRQENGRVSKKRNVEKAEFNPPKFDPPMLDPPNSDLLKFDAYPMFSASLDASSLPPLSDLDSAQATGGESAESGESAVSRATSVSLHFFAMSLLTHDP